MLLRIVVCGLPLGGPAGAQTILLSGQSRTVGLAETLSGYPGFDGIEDQRYGQGGDGGGGGGSLGAWVSGGELVVQAGGQVLGGQGGDGGGIAPFGEPYDGVGGRGGGAGGGAGGIDPANSPDPNVRHGGNGVLGGGGGGGHGAGDVIGGYPDGTIPVLAGNGGMGAVAGGGGGGGDNGIVPQVPGQGGAGFGRGGNGMGTRGGGGGGGPAFLVTSGTATMDGGLVRGGPGGSGGEAGSGGFGAVVAGGNLEVNGGTLQGGASGGSSGNGGVGLYLLGGSATLADGDLLGGDPGSQPGTGTGGGGTGAVIVDGQMTITGGRIFGGVGDLDGTIAEFRGTGLLVQGGQVEIRGGQISGGFAAGSLFFAGIALDIQAGEVRLEGGTINTSVFGSSLSSILVRGGSLTLVGGSFQLDGTPLAVTGGTDFEVTERSGILTAILEDSHPLSINLAGVTDAGKLFLSATGTGTGISLPAALDLPGQSWTTGGQSDWAGQSTTSHDGIDAAQSGSIGDGQESWLESVFPGPGTLSFWWKVSSEPGYDKLAVDLDGVEQPGSISGAVDWTQRTLPLPSGMHTVRWRYHKDGSFSGGSDTGWIDEVSFVFSPQDYDSWALAAGLTDADADPNAIPFHEGVPNLLKYAFNMEGSGPDSRRFLIDSQTAGLPFLFIHPEGSASRILVEYRRRIGSNLQYNPAKSTSLENGSWVPFGSSPYVEPIDAEWELVIYLEPFNPDPVPRIFARVEVSQP